MDEAHKAKMQAGMEQAAYWIVQNGLRLVTTSGTNALSTELIDRWGIQLWVQPRIDDGRYIALFRIKGGGIHYEIHCLARNPLDAVYEYWLLKVTAQAWSGETNRVEFLVTKADRIDAIRELLDQSSQFFDHYAVGDRTLVQLPLDNLRLLYDMQAWRYPAHYKQHSKVAKTEIHLDEDGVYSAHAVSTAAHPF